VSLGSASQISSPTSCQVKLGLRSLFAVESLWDNIWHGTVVCKELNFNFKNKNGMAYRLLKDV
jgi:hypothetical protein